MTVTLTYDDTLARVRIDATAVTGSAAFVDRSCDGGTTWTRVRGANSVPVSGGSTQLTTDDYEFCTDDRTLDPACPPVVTGVSNFYRVCGFNPESMLTVTGGPNSFASTPDNAALDIVGDIDIRIGIRPDDWTPAQDQVLISKYLIAGDQRSWVLRLLTTGKLEFKWTTAGTFASTVTATSTTSVPIPPSAGGHAFVRVTLDVDNGSSGKTVTFYHATSMSGPWTQVGAPVTTSGTTSIFSSTANVEIASGNSGGAIFSGGAMFSGDVTKAEIRSGIDGTAAANPDFTAETPGTTAFTDAAGRVWTVQSTAKIQEDPDPPEDVLTISCQQNSIVPVLTGPWLKSISQPFLNQQVDVLRDFEDVERSPRGGVFDIVGANLPVAVTDLRGGKRWVLRICTHNALEALELDLLLASGDPVFLHVPTRSNLPVHSMYAVIGESTARKRAYANERLWSLPLTQVRAPSADVVGSTITWQCVIDTYATWQAVIDDNATWADLLEKVCDPTTSQAA